MKPLIFFTFILSSFLCSCNEEATDSPLTFNLYFQIVDKNTGKDYFLSNNIPYDSLVFERFWKETVPVYSFRDTAVVFGPSTSVGSFAFVHFNQQIDTLQILREGEDINFYDQIWRFYFNGELTEIYDFRNDHEFALKYQNSNSHGIYDNVDPIVTVLKK